MGYVLMLIGILFYVYAVIGVFIFGKSDPFISGFKAIEDWIMWITVARNRGKFKYLDESYAIYRIHPDNMTKNKDFMIYWVARAISYIADHLIDQKDLNKFNELLDLETFTEDEASEVEEMIDISADVISSHLKNKIQEMVKLYEKF